MQRDNGKWDFCQARRTFGGGGNKIVWVLRLPLKGRRGSALQQRVEKAMDCGREQLNRGRKQEAFVLDKSYRCAFFGLHIVLEKLEVVISCKSFHKIQNPSYYLKC